MDNLMKKPISSKFFTVNPNTRRIAKHNDILTYEFMLSLIGCTSIEMRGLYGGNVLWFNEEPAPMHVLVDVFVLDGIDLADSIAVITGPELPCGRFGDCTLDLATLRRSIKWAPRRKVVGERTFATSALYQLDWVYDPPI
jgi:hypothetical protein